MIQYSVGRRFERIREEGMISVDFGRDLSEETCSRVLVALGLWKEFLEDA